MKLSWRKTIVDRPVSKPVESETVESETGLE